MNLKELIVLAIVVNGTYILIGWTWKLFGWRIANWIDGKTNAIDRASKKRRKEREIFGSERWLP